MSVSTGQVTGGGPAAARTIGLAAEVVATVARGSRDCWPDAPGIAAQALELQERCPALALEDEVAWTVALAALGDAVDGRRTDVRKALEESAALLVTIAETGADLADLAALAARLGQRAYSADAAGAAVLAHASVRVAGYLVGVNLATRADDDLSTRVAAAERRAEQAVTRALADVAS